VKNDRVVLDEPTDLPEGEVVELDLHLGEGLDDADREALHRELRASIAEQHAGQLVDGDDVVAEIRARMA
jgi:hypothetical protein